MIRWNNDYNRIAHPLILEALAKNADESNGGYGIDKWCESASAEIKKHLGDVNADIHFLVGGTQTNFTVIASALRPFQSVISADSGHICAHETGAVENTGHKIHTLPHTNGKITAAQIAADVEYYLTSNVKEHITQPKMVYISNPTEYGTIYKKEELAEISAVCRKYGLYLFIDGARMGYGLTSIENDLTLEDLAKLTDVFYIGGTKCGAMFGEALVITNDSLKPDFRSYIKQNGGMLAKGWLLGLQFYTLFSTGAYFDSCRKANEYAMRIKNAFLAKGIELYLDSPTNQQFVILTKDQYETLEKKNVSEFIDAMPDGRVCVRYCTSWSTNEADVDVLIGDIDRM